MFLQYKELTVRIHPWLAQKLGFGMLLPGLCFAQAGSPDRPGWEVAVETTESAEDPAFVTPGVPHPGSDQIWWVPTYAQAQEVAAATGRLILVMGSVSDWRDGY